MSRNRQEFPIYRTPRAEQLRSRGTETSRREQAASPGWGLLPPLSMWHRPVMDTGGVTEKVPSSQVWKDCEFRL